MDEPPEWDAALAGRLEGSLVLVGITYEEPGGPRLDQFFGVVETADPHEGVALRLSGNRAGELYWLPPDLRSFFPAPPGSYRLRATGEVVVDPDFTSEWTITPPPG